MVPNDAEIFTRRELDRVEIDLQEIDAEAIRRCINFVHYQDVTHDCCCFAFLFSASDSLKFGLWIPTLARAKNWERVRFF